MKFLYQYHLEDIKMLSHVKPEKKKRKII